MFAYISATLIVSSETRQNECDIILPSRVHSREVIMDWESDIWGDRFLII